MNEMAAAFAELAEAKREVTGGGDVVILGGQRIRDAVAEEIPYDLALIAGGEAETGQVRVQIPLSSWPDEPQKGLDIEINGKHLEVLSVTERNRATWELLCGSIVAEDS